MGLFSKTDHQAQATAAFTKRTSSVLKGALVALALSANNRHNPSLTDSTAEIVLEYTPLRVKGSSSLLTGRAFLVAHSDPRLHTSLPHGHQPSLPSDPTIPVGETPIPPDVTTSLPNGYTPLPLHHKHLFQFIS